MRTRSARPRFPQHARERGAVLLVALVFLVLLTLLAIGASSGSLLQQRMVSATRSAQLATMAGDAALRGAEWKIWSASGNVGSGLVCDSGQFSTAGCIRYQPTSTPYAAGGAVTQFEARNNAWLSLTGPITYTGPDPSGFTSGTGVIYATANVAANPQYIIEDMGLVKPPGAGPQHESGDTGTTINGSGHVNIHIYRITARAAGGALSTVRVVQSTFDAQSSN